MGTNSFQLPLPSMTNGAAAAHALHRDIRSQYRVRSAQELHQLVSDCVYCPQVALSVDTMHIALVYEGSLITSILRTALRLMDNLTDLILEFPRGTVPPSLARVNLPRLRLFKSNMPHSKMLVFLLSHADTTVNSNATLRSLVIDDCGGRSRVCPLRHCVMDGITELECPLTCAGLVLGKGLERFTTWHRTATPPASLLLASLTPVPFLSFLSIEVFARDRAILLMVPKFAPRVDSLRVIEVDGNGAPTSPSRRLINDCRLWALMIRRLTHLQDLHVRTPSDFVRSRGNEDQEKRRLWLWLTGSRLNGWGKGYLKRIGVHYGTRVGGVISHWDVGHDWVRYAHVAETVAENVLI